MIFGTDWPGIPGIAANARAVASLMPDEETAALVLAGNATRVYNLKPLQPQAFTTSSLYNLKPLQPQAFTTGRVVLPDLCR
jgi:hypothetical protein